MFLLERITYKVAFGFGFAVGFIKALVVICRLLLKVATNGDQSPERAAIAKMLNDLG